MCVVSPLFPCREREREREGGRERERKRGRERERGFCILRKVILIKRAISISAQSAHSIVVWFTDFCCFDQELLQELVSRCKKAIQTLSIGLLSNFNDIHILVTMLSVSRMLLNEQACHVLLNSIPATYANYVPPRWPLHLHTYCNTCNPPLI